MGNNEEVKIQTTETGEGAIPLKSDRPEWLPEKFESAEELAKSYSELEKKLGDSKEEETPTEVTKEEAEKATGVTLDKFYDEYAEKGELAEDSYAELAKQGLNKELVDSYIEGQKAVADKQTAEMHSAVGGKDSYDKMITWASETLSETEVKAFNSVMEKGNPDEMKLAINGMSSRWKSAVGEPKLVKGEAPKVASDMFKSTYEVAQAINDKRYSHDTSYRKSVEEKLKRSEILG